MLLNSDASQMYLKWRAFTSPLVGSSHLPSHLPAHVSPLTAGLLDTWDTLSCRPMSDPNFGNAPIASSRRVPSPPAGPGSPLRSPGGTSRGLREGEGAVALASVSESSAVKSQEGARGGSVRQRSASLESLISHVAVRPQDGGRAPIFTPRGGGLLPPGGAVEGEGSAADHQGWGVASSPLGEVRRCPAAAVMAPPPINLAAARAFLARRMNAGVAPALPVGLSPAPMPAGGQGQGTLHGGLRAGGGINAAAAAAGPIILGHRAPF